MGIAGAIASIASFVAFGPKEIGFGLMSAVCVAFAWTCLHYVKKAHELNRRVRALVDCREILHDTIHEARDELKLTNLAIAGREVVASRRILVGLERCFTRLVGARCQASIMLPVLSSDPRTMILRTTIRSLTEPVDRREFETRLCEDQGLAGKAFKTGRPICCSDFDKEKDFFAVREGYEKYYRSGIACPFKVNGKVYGVVNLDCKEKDVFDDKSEVMAQCFGDLIALVHQLMLDPRKN